MKNIIATLVFAILPYICVAQNPEQLVIKYVRLLNEWLGSPDNMAKREKVLNMFQTEGKGSGIKDIIVEKYNVGRSNCNPTNYLTILYDERQKGSIKVEIIGKIKDNTDKHGTILTAILRYYGGIFKKKDTLTINGHICYIPKKKLLPCPGAMVYVEGSSEKTITDDNGNFTLKIKKSNSPILVFFREGFQSQKIIFSDLNDFYNIILKKSEKE